MFGSGKVTVKVAKRTKTSQSESSETNKIAEEQINNNHSFGCFGNFGEFNEVSFGSFGHFGGGFIGSLNAEPTQMQFHDSGPNPFGPDEQNKFIMISTKEYDRLVQIKNVVEKRFSLCSNEKCEFVIPLKRQIIDERGIKFSIFTHSAVECRWCKKYFCESCCNNKVYDIPNKDVYIANYCEECKPKYKKYSEEADSGAC